jgi:hypothetical protein
MTIPAKAAVSWLLLFAFMFANGAARVLALEPHLGEHRARQAASLSGAALVLVVAWFFVRFTGEATTRQLLWVGLAWLLATLAFEFLFGHFVSRLGWSALLADYDITHGRLWPLVLLCVCLGPWFWSVVRR